MNTRLIARLFQSWLLLALGVLVSAHIVPGIAYDSGATLFVVVLLLGLLNVFLKPLLLLFTLPFIVLTMGLGVLVINALLFMLVGSVVEGFYVSGFGAAFFGGLIVSVISLFLNMFLGGGVRVEPAPGKRGPPGRKRKDDDIIDI